MIRLRLLFPALALLSLGAPLRAEVNEIHAAQQFGLSYLALMMMEDGKLVEKEAERAGIGPLKVSWVKLGNSNAMNDALLSGSLDFASGGVPNLVTVLQFDFDINRCSEVANADPAPGFM